MVKSPSFVKSLSTLVKDKLFAGAAAEASRKLRGSQSKVANHESPGKEGRGRQRMHRRRHFDESAGAAVEESDTGTLLHSFSSVGLLTSWSYY